MSDNINLKQGRTWWDDKIVICDIFGEVSEVFEMDEEGDIRGPVRPPMGFGL